MTTGPSRGALVALASGMALVVSACGSDPTYAPTTDPPLVTIGLPTTTAAAGAATPPGPTSIAAAAAPPDELVLPGLPALDDPVPTYSWSAGQRPTREDFEALAEALGATGDVSEGVSGTDEGWSLDGDNLELMLHGGVEGAWSYSGPPPFPWPSEEEPWPTNDTGEPVTIGPPPTYAVPGAPLPDSYPSHGEAQELAREIVAALGLDPDAFEWRNGLSSFSTEVEAWWVIDGGVSPVKLQFGFGPDGMLLHASGQLVAPEAGPTVDRIGIVAAEERLRAEIERSRADPGWGNILVGGVVVPGDQDATIVLSEPDDPDDAATPPTTAVVHPTAAPPPTVAPEMVGRIVDVEESWQVIREESGTRLLPAYTFIEATGMRYTVSAVP